VGRAADLDPGRTAELLLGALGRLTDVDLVVAGRQAGDWDHGQVGYLLAEGLGWPCVGLVRQVWFEGDELRVRHDHAGGQQVVSIQPPAVLTVTNDDALLLRMARVNDLMAAQRRPITRWDAAELGSAAGAGAGRRGRVTGQLVTRQLVTGGQRWEGTWSRDAPALGFGR